MVTIDLSQLINSGYLSFLVIAFGAALLYFGKIIQDLQVESGGTLGYYEKGILYVIISIFIPFPIAYMLYKFELFYFDYNIWMFVQMALTIYLIIDICYSRKLKNENKVRHETEISRLFSIVVILTTSFFSFYSNLYLYHFLNGINQIFINFILSVLFTFMALTIAAQKFSYQSIRYYPEVKIYLENNPVPLQGIMKRYDDTIKLLTNEKFIRINKDKVVYIEEPKEKISSSKLMDWLYKIVVK
jgi:hypothetical protein